LKERVSDIIEKPVERNFDKAVNQALDKLQDGQSIDISCCEKTEKLASEPEEEP